MKLKVAPFAALALLTVGVAVQAAPPPQLVSDWGSDPTVKNAVRTLGVGAFSDMFTFTLTANNTNSVSSVSSFFSLGGTDYVKITNGSFALYAFGADNLAGTGDDVLVPGSITSFGNDVFGQKQVSLSAGKYYLNVKGSADGLLGGKYVVASTFAAAVPEPQTYALMLAGLAGLGFIARRRSI